MHSKPSELVFVSYRSSEREIARRVSEALVRAGVKVWMDTRHGIRCGEDWRRSLMEALDTCGAMIVVLSPAYVKAAYTRRELARADQRGIPVFPVLIETVPSELWPIELQRVQWVDCRHLTTETFSLRMDELVEGVRNKKELFADNTDEERDYLASFISQVERERRVTSFVTLAADAVVDDTAQEVRESHDTADDWGLEPVFAVLDDLNASAGKSAPAANAHTYESVLDAMRDHLRFVLLGDPGGGKTTCLRRYAHWAAVTRSTGGSAPLPVWISLSNWLPGESCDSFLRHQWPISGNPGDTMSSGSVVLCLDGLNEIGLAATSRAEELRRWIVAIGADAKVGVTCRASDYAGRFDLGLPQVWLRPLDDHQVELFASAYLGEHATTFLSELGRLEPKRHSWRELLDTVRTGGLEPSLVGWRKKEPHPTVTPTIARNPFILTALLRLYQLRRLLADSVGPVLSALVEALWEREAIERTPGWSDAPVLREALGSLAITMIQQHHGVSMLESEAVRVMRNEGLLAAAQSASLLSRSDRGMVAFTHQLLQEFFAAARLATSEPNSEWEILTDQEIDESVRLDLVDILLGLRKECKPVVEMLLQQSDPWPGLCCVVVGYPASRAVLVRATATASAAVKRAREQVETMEELWRTTSGLESDRIWESCQMREAQAEAMSDLLSRLSRSAGE
jgi:hypothetical protein